MTSGFSHYGYFWKGRFVGEVCLGPFHDTVGLVSKRTQEKKWLLSSDFLISVCKRVLWMPVPCSSPSFRPLRWSLLQCVAGEAHDHKVPYCLIWQNCWHSNCKGVFSSYQYITHSCTLSSHPTSCGGWNEKCGKWNGEKKKARQKKYCSPEKVSTRKREFTDTSCCIFEFDAFWGTWGSTYVRKKWRGHPQCNQTLTDEKGRWGSSMCD